MSYPYQYTDSQRVCSICFDPLYSDTDYCQECGDHTTALVPCTACNGTGEVDELDQAKVTGKTISPPYHKVKCENCEEGWVEE